MSDKTQSLLEAAQELAYELHRNLQQTTNDTASCVHIATHLSAEDLEGISVNHDEAKNRVLTMVVNLLSTKLRQERELLSITIQPRPGGGVEFELTLKPKAETDPTRS